MASLLSGAEHFFFSVNVHETRKDEFVLTRTTSLDGGSHVAGGDEVSLLSDSDGEIQADALFSHSLMIETSSGDTIGILYILEKSSGKIINSIGIFNIGTITFVAEDTLQLTFEVGVKYTIVFENKGESKTLTLAQSAKVGQRSIWANHSHAQIIGGLLTEEHLQRLHSLKQRLSTAIWVKCTGSFLAFSEMERSSSANTADQTNVEERESGKKVGPAHSDR